MQIDLEYLRRHYASLSDEGLLAMDETELVADARRIYDEELAQRGLTPEVEGDESDADTDERVRPDEDEDENLGEELNDEHSEESDGDLGNGPEPGWLRDAAIAASFISTAGSDTAPDAAEARDALQAAGIPCYLSTRKQPRRAARPQPEIQVLVPGKMNLQAESVLDKAIFNREIETQWKTHFEMLSDEELRAVDLQALFGGLTDRIERVTRAYREELAQREPE